MGQVLWSLLFLFSTRALASASFIFGSQCANTASLAQQSLFNPAAANIFGDFILVDKARKLLHVFSEDQIVRTYHIALGKEPLGKKHQEGDNKTPEGLYSVSYKNPESAYHLSLAISYPDQEDQDWADQHGVSAGGDIMVHGLPNNPLTHPFLRHPQNNWTKGCIAVTDAEIEEVWRMVATDTAIEICP